MCLPLGTTESEMNIHCAFSIASNLKILELNMSMWRKKSLKPLKSLQNLIVFKLISLHYGTIKDFPLLANILPPKLETLGINLKQGHLPFDFDPFKDFTVDICPNLKSLSFKLSTTNSSPLLFPILFSR